MSYPCSQQHEIVGVAGLINVKGEESCTVITDPGTRTLRQFKIFVNGNTIVYQYRPPRIREICGPCISGETKRYCDGKTSNEGWYIKKQKARILWNYD